MHRQFANLGPGPDGAPGDAEAPSPVGRRHVLAEFGVGYRVSSRWYAPPAHMGLKVYQGLGWASTVLEVVEMWWSLGRWFPGTAADESHTVGIRPTSLV